MGGAESISVFVCVKDTLTKLAQQSVQPEGESRGFHSEALGKISDNHLNLYKFQVKLFIIGFKRREHL